MAVDITAVAATSRARAAANLAPLLEHQTHAEGLEGAFGDDAPDSTDPAGASVLWQAIQAEGHRQARETAEDAAAAHHSGARIHEECISGERRSYTAGAVSRTLRYTPLFSIWSSVLLRLTPLQV